MKSFIVSITIFAFTVTVVVANSFAVTERLDEIISVLDSLPNADSDADDLSSFTEETERICTLWRNERKFLSLSVREEELRECTTAIEGLYAYCLSDSVPDYNASLSQCRNLLHTLRRRESFAFINII